jgi:hypothetical protein
MYSSRGSSSYDSLVSAAQDVHRNVNEKYFARTWFTPGMQQAVVTQSGSAMAKVGSAVGRPVEFEFKPRGPFDASPNDQEWRTIGRAFDWRIQRSCATADYDGAVRDEVTATKFGFSLVGGDVMDASLGFATVDDVRKELAPKLNQLGAGQLNNLAAGLESALDNAPLLTTTFEHEKLNMLQSVQYVQDSFLRNDLSDIKKQLGSDSREAVDYLQNLRGQSSPKQLAYFKGFADEANDESQWLSLAAVQPLEKRSQINSPQPDKNRPWRTFAKSFFSAGEPLLSMRDATLARTRLLIIQARILARIKSGQSAPNDLSGFDKNLTVDPYTGRQFIYRAAGTDFTIYSVGSDLKDDGGQTNEGFATPDLTLEIPQS